MHGQKLIYKLRLQDEEKLPKKRVFFKVLKLDENNQYGFAITKPLPTGVFRKKKPIDLK